MGVEGNVAAERLNGVEQVHRLFSDERFACVIAVKRDGFRFRMIFHPAVIFDGNAVHQLRDQFNIIVFVIDFDHAHR
jgi:hypothetical protein